MSFNIEKIRLDFPILKEKIYGKNLIYFDNAATTQKPQCVIDTISEFYSKYNSNIHRGVHYLSNFTTVANENSRETIRKFINAEKTEEIIFTSGTTQAINLVAFSFGEAFIKEGDEIIISEMEHHSNIVPWQLMCERKKAKIKVLTFNDRGELEIEKLHNLINERTKLVCVCHISNALGTINPLKEIISISHRYNVPVLIDGAQAVQHIKTDVKDLDCDFYVFSGHKIYGPTGTGVLFGKEKLLEQMPPYQGGGEMISKVSFEKTTFNVLPFKFEAGTPNFIDIVGFAKAIEYIEEIGLKEIENYENRLLNYATKKLEDLEWIRIIGTAEKKSGVISFLPDNIHFYDTGVLLDQMGIAIRTGSHCADTVMQHYSIEGTARMSFAFYNTFDEIDITIEALKKVKSICG